jgi:hypothetical protein
LTEQEKRHQLYIRKSQALIGDLRRKLERAGKLASDLSSEKESLIYELTITKAKLVTAQDSLIDALKKPGLDK